LGVGPNLKPLYLENGKSHNKFFGILKKKEFYKTNNSFFLNKNCLKINNPPKKKQHPFWHLKPLVSVVIS
jgi:hypothetical protein